MISIECTKSSTSSVSSSVSSLGPTGKRLDYITWHQHHMYMAKMVREMSTEKDPIGCYVVDREHYQIVSGYSGEIALKDDPCNCAILSALHKLKRKAQCDVGFTMYITSLPSCNPCLARIAELRISKIWYWSPLDATTEPDAQLQDILRSNYIELVKYTPTRTISLDFHEQ